MSRIFFESPINGKNIRVDELSLSIDVETFPIKNITNVSIKKAEKPSMLRAYLGVVFFFVMNFFAAELDLMNLVAELLIIIFSFKIFHIEPTCHHVEFEINSTTTHSISMDVIDQSQLSWLINKLDWESLSSMSHQEALKLGRSINQAIDQSNKE